MRRPVRTIPVVPINAPQPHLAPSKDEERDWIFGRYDGEKFPESILSAINGAQGAGRIKTPTEMAAEIKEARRQVTSARARGPRYHNMTEDEFDNWIADQQRHIRVLELRAIPRRRYRH